MIMFNSLSLYRFFGTKDPAATKYRPSQISGLDDETVQTFRDKSVALKLKEYNSSVSTLYSRLENPFSSPNNKNSPIFDQDPQQLLIQCLTHQSYKQGTEPENSRLATLGQSVFKTIVSQIIFEKYPNLPSKMLSSTVDTLSSDDSSIFKFAKRAGIKDLMRYIAIDDDEQFPSRYTESIANSGAFSILGALLTSQGYQKAKSFTEKFILVEDLNIKQVIKTDRPHVYLADMLRRQNKTAPQYAIIEETGRYTHSPVFVSGVYVDGKLLAQGAAGSIKSSQKVAAQNALEKHYAAEYQKVENPEF